MDPYGLIWDPYGPIWAPYGVHMVPYGLIWAPWDFAVFYSLYMGVFGVSIPVKGDVFMNAYPLFATTAP